MLLDPLSQCPVSVPRSGMVNPQILINVAGPVASDKLLVIRWQVGSDCRFDDGPIDSRGCEFSQRRLELSEFVNSSHLQFHPWKLSGKLCHELSA